MKQEDEIQLLKELAGILERQIELVRHDNIAAMNELVGHSKQLAMKITAANLIDRPEYDGWRKRLTELYLKLQLVLSTQKEAVARQLSAIDKGKKTLAVYQGSI
jgi:hypothetical protein